MNLKPLGERIVVKHLEVEKTTKSGLVLPGSASEKPKYAEVVVISEEVLKDDETKDLLKVGDYVIYSNYSGTDVESGDDKYTIVELEDVQAIVEL